MAVYAIGDVQGCYDPLQRLLAKLAFDPNHDRLWLVGDLVNRGPQSLTVLRFIRSLGDSATAVLGNHDLTLLAVAEGYSRIRSKDTFQDILHAPDSGELLNWLRQRPLIHYDAKLNFLMVHAGLPPQWNLQQALACADEVEKVLRSPDYREFLAAMFGNEPCLWRNDLSGIERLRCITNYLTRMRFCTDEGALSFSHKGAPGSQPVTLKPWFETPGRCNTEINIVFGHWAALGFYRRPGIYALDSGCVWGNTLTALRLDAPEQVYCVGCTDKEQI